MKEVQVLTWCDGPHEAAPPAVQTMTIQIDQGKPRSIDLCERCIVSMVVPVAEVLDKFGVEPEPPQAVVVKRSNRKELSSACPLCEHVAESRSALGQHLKRMHDTGFRALKEQGYDI